MSLPVLAQHMAAKGRGPDSMLVHMSPQEVAGLHALALKHGGSLTINPDTGLVEAGFLSSILPMVAGFALDAFLPGVGSAIGGALGTSAAVGTGIAVGGLTGLATGSLSKGLTAGLGAYGGAGLSQGLLGAGASALGTDAFNAANTLNAGANPAAVQAAVEDRIANATFGEKLAAGFDAAKANPMGFIKPNAGVLAAAAAPVIADQMVPTTVKAPPLPPAYIRPFQFDANTRKVTAQTPVLASEWGARSFPDFIPKTMATGGIVALADGGEAAKPPAPVAAPDPYAKYNTLSGASKAAYDYLMGNTPAPTGTVAPPRTLTCPAGFHLENGACVPDAVKTVIEPPVNKGCGPGYHEQNGVCVPDSVVIPPTTLSCPVGFHEEGGKCVKDKVIDTSCPAGMQDDGAGNCVPIIKTTSCPTGQVRNAAGDCVPITTTTTTTSCPAGQVRNAAGDCVDIATTTTTTGGCLPGQISVNGVCTWPGTDTTVVTGPSTTGPSTTGPSTTGPSTTGPGTTGPGVVTGPGTDAPTTTGPGGTNLPGSGVTVTTGPATTTTGPTTGPASTSTPGSSTTTSTATGIATLGGAGATDGGTMGGEPTNLPRQFGDFTTQVDPNAKIRDLNNPVWGTVTVQPVGGENGLFEQPGQYIGGYYAFTDNNSGGSDTKIAVPEGTMVTDRMGNSYPAGLPGIMGTGGGGAAKITDDELSSGRMAFAAGGMPSYAMGGGLGTLGGYSDGGRLLKGPGDGVSDSIPATIGRKQQPARLADGEFVIPARIVSELGNGSTDAGARKLYAMMDRIQKSRGKTVGKGKVAANSRADKHLPA